MPDLPRLSAPYTCRFFLKPVGMMAESGSRVQLVAPFNTEQRCIKMHPTAGSTFAGFRCRVQLVAPFDTDLKQRCIKMHPTAGLVFAGFGCRVQLVAP